MANNHGGHRHGAGRPKGSVNPLAAHRRKHMIMLSDAEWALAQSLGGGNASQGVRLALVRTWTPAAEPPDVA